MLRSIFAVLLMSSLALADGLKPTVEELVDFETKSNAVAKRSNDAVRIENYEIPLRLLERDISFERLPHAAQNALIFSKNGEKMVRWLINPEDTKWHKELETWMKKNGVSTQRHTYFEGYMTASRSYIVRDPKSDLAFSMKVSTDVTGGNWRDKKQTWDDARQVKISSDYAMKAMEMRTPENFLFMDEPLVFGVKDIDQGMLLRLLGDLNVKDRVYVPGFSALHEETGRQIAEMNGSKDPAEFWRQHYVRPLGKAIAELYAMTGLSYDSPHSQNFLVELDGDMRPTGKIVFRDLGDSYLTKEIAQAMKATKLLSVWESGNILNGRASIAQGILHGNEKPSWVSEAMYDSYGKTFFVEFEKELSRITRIPIEELMRDGSHSRSGDYFSKGYQLFEAGKAKTGWTGYISGLVGGGSSGSSLRPGWGQYLDGLQKYGGLRPSAMACSRILGM